MVSVAKVVLPSLAGLLEPLARVLTHGLEQQTSAARLGDDEALIDQRLDLIQRRARDGLGVIERERSAEHGQASKGHLLGLVEQVVAPGDRRPQRPLALGQVMGAARQHRQ